MVAANLRRLMARDNMTIHSVARAAGLDARTVKAVLHQRQRPHARTLHKLARGMGVCTDEFFHPVADAADGVSPGRQNVDRTTNPHVHGLLAQQPERFANWTAGEVDELFSRVGVGGELNEQGAQAAAAAIEDRRDVLEKAALVLETAEAELLTTMIEMLYRRVTNLE